MRILFERRSTSLTRETRLSDDKARGLALVDKRISSHVTNGSSNERLGGLGLRREPARARERLRP